MGRLEWMFLQLVEWSIPAMFMIAAVMLVRKLCRRIPRYVVCVLWMLVGLRLAVPMTIESEYSLIPQQVTDWAAGLTDGKEDTRVDNRVQAVSGDVTANRTEAEEDAATINRAETEKDAMTEGAVTGNAFADSHVTTGTPENDKIQGNSGVTADAYQKSDSNPNNEAANVQQSDGVQAGVAGADFSGKQDITAVPEKTSYHMSEVLAFVWLAGVAVMLTYSILSYVRMRRLLRDAVHESENVWLSDRIASPFLLGIKARIYLPFSLSVEEREYVLAHERAHIARLDHMTKLVGYLILAVYWFNPLVWAAYILLGRDIELACDEHVVRGYGVQEKKNYAQTLLKCSTVQKTAAERRAAMQKWLQLQPKR